jgi:signal transduction histidine kinase
MKENYKRLFRGSVEAAILLALLGLFVGVLFLGWGGAIKLRQTIASNLEQMNSDSSALSELEELRNLNEMRVANRRAYFLLGSQLAFDKQDQQRQRFEDGLAKFEQEHSLPQAHEIVRQLKALEQQEQSIFDQGIDYRDKATESKIVAQFYNSKASPLVPQADEKFEQLKNLLKSEIEGGRDRARKAGLEVQAMIIDGMRWLTSAMAVLFIGMTLFAVYLISVRRRYLRERDRLVQEATQAILARDEVIAAATRDLREPLNELSAYAEDLKAASGDESSADRIQNTVTEMQALIDDIYDQKKSDMGSLNLRLEQLPVGDVLETVQSMMLPLAKQRSITLRVDAVSASVMAYVDRERVLRVLGNLLGNAIKFSPRNTRVSIKVKSDAQFVNIAIHDAGPGIPEERLTGLFDNFWQSQKTAEQGAGVGLAVVKTIVEAHGGKVRAENNSTGGCIFTITLPRRRPAGAQLKKTPVQEVRVVRANSSNAPEANQLNPEL